MSTYIFSGKKKRFFILVLSLTICSLAFTIGFIFVKAISVAPRSFHQIQFEQIPVSPYTLSAEQLSLLKEFSYPDAFTILFYDNFLEDETPQSIRLEIWTYHRTGQEMTMINGQIIDQTDIEILNKSIPSPYHPEQFIRGMNANSAIGAANLHEYIDAPLETEGIPNGKLLFGQQIVYGFLDGELYYVESFALEESIQP